MKGMLTLLVGSMFIFSVSTAMAADTTKTAMDSKWICTTNASSASTDADKKADSDMANNPNSIAAAFAFAAQNCRDCTKISCEVQK